MKQEISSAEYYSFISDAVAFLLDAAVSHRKYINGNDEGYVTQHLLFTARWSFISTCLALEAAGNKALQALPISAKSHDSFERLRPIEKYELYALYRGKHNFRSDNRVAKIQEIMTARNRYVHPKSKPIPLSSFEKGLDILTSPSKHLRLPSHFSMVSFEHARDSLMAALDFEAWFFIDYCGLSHTDTIKLLTDFEDINSGDLISAHEQFNLDLRTLSRSYARTQIETE